MKILIIEDEINAFEYLSTIIRKVQAGVEILAHLESVEEAVNWLHQHEHPDLIFLDIQLSDGLSFEIFKYVQIQVPIIFTTAFDQYAIDAFRVNSIDYLLKPIHVDDLERALQKYHQQQRTNTPDLSKQLQSIFGQLQQQKKHRCLVKKGNHFEFINIKDIALVNSEDGLTFLHTFQMQRHLYTSTVEGMMETLDERQFFQINRGQIVNIDAIAKIHPYFNQRMKIELNIPAHNIDLIISRSKMQAFKSWVDK
jgi:DNA-binding LytR/AlgR family response regulator